MYFLGLVLHTCEVIMKFRAIFFVFVSFPFLEAHENITNPGKSKEDEKNPKTSFKGCSSGGNSGSPIDLIHPWRKAPSSSSVPGHYTHSGDSIKFPHNELNANPWFGRYRDHFYTFIKDNQMRFEFLKEEAPTSEMKLRAEGWGDEHVIASGRILWGNDNHHGSEHMINGKRFPMELQLLMYKKSSESLASALEGKAVIALSLLFQPSAEDNPHVNELILGVTTRLDRGATDRADMRVHGPINLKNILTNGHTVGINYFEYTGSSTIPPCQDGVKWIVFDVPLSVSVRQLGILRKYGTDANGKDLGDHFRPVQPLGGRTIKYYGSTLIIYEDENVILARAANVHANYGTYTFSNFLLIVCFFI